MPNFSFGLLGQFETILPDENMMPPEQYLEGIDRSTLLRIGTSLIRHNPHTSEFRDWKALLNMWFRPGNNVFKNYVWNKSQQLSDFHGSAISFLFPPAGLKFFELAFNMPETAVEQSELQSEVNLFKAYLYFISDITKRETINPEYAATIEPADKLALIILHQQFPTGEFINYHLYNVFNCQMIKAYMLFEFLEKRPEAQTLLEEMYQHFGLHNWQEYFRFIFPLVYAETQKLDAAWADVNIPQNEQYGQNCFFLDALSLKKLDEELNADFKLLSGNPLYKKSEGLYSVIYPLFLIEKIFKGLFFHFKVLYDAMPVKMINNWNTFYTKNFAESYLLYNLMEYIYEKRSYIRVTGDQMDDTLKGKGGIDYYLRQGNKICLFESKSVFINADIKQSGDLKKILSELKAKFYYDQKDNGKQKPKAVRQLARNVARVLKMENGFDTNYKPENVSIYPIVIVHDVSFNTPGLNHLLNKWFKEEIAILTDQGLNTARVKMLSIINIDTLIMYADYLRLKKNTIIELLDTYIATRFFNEKRKYKSDDHLKNSYGETLLSFSVFMDQYTKTGFRKVPNTLWNGTVLKYVPA